MSIYFRKCKTCGEIYDIGINKEECPTCRLIKKEGEENED